MRFLWPLIWAFLLCSAISYVLASMAGHDFQIGATLVMTVVVSLAVYILGEGMIADASDQ